MAATAVSFIIVVVVFFSMCSYTLLFHSLYAALPSHWYLHSISFLVVKFSYVTKRRYTFFQQLNGGIRRKKHAKHSVQYAKMPAEITTMTRNLRISASFVTLLYIAE